MLRNPYFNAAPAYLPTRPGMVPGVVAPPAPVASTERTFCFDSGINSMLPLMVLNARNEDTTWDYTPTQLSDLFGTVNAMASPSSESAASDGSKANLFWLMLARSQDSQDCDGQTNSGFLAVMLRKLLLDDLSWGETGTSRYPVGFGDEANFDILDTTTADLSEGFTTDPTFDPVLS